MSSNQLQPSYDSVLTLARTGKRLSKAIIDYQAHLAAREAIAIENAGSLEVWLDLVQALHEIHAIPSWDASCNLLDETEFSGWRDSLALRDEYIGSIAFRLWVLRSRFKKVLPFVGEPDFSEPAGSECLCSWFLVAPGHNGSKPTPSKLAGWWAPIDEFDLLADNLRPSAARCNTLVWDTMESLLDHHTVASFDELKRLSELCRQKSPDPSVIVRFILAIERRREEEHGRNLFHPDWREYRYVLNEEAFRWPDLDDCSAAEFSTRERLHLDEAGFLDHLEYWNEVFAGGFGDELRSEFDDLSMFLRDEARHSATIPGGDGQHQDESPIAAASDRRGQDLDGSGGWTWQAVRDELERLRLKGERYTSQRRLAKRIGCSTTTVGYAIKNGRSELQEWASTQHGKSRLDVAPEVAQVAFATTPQKREADPTDIIEDADCDKALDVLKCMIGPDEWEKLLKERTPAEVRALAETAARDPDVEDQMLLHRRRTK